jgi:hypothetical protein
MNRTDVQSTSSRTIRFDDVSFSVEGRPVSDVTYCRDGKEVFAAYLEQDTDCENPLETSELGSIYSAHRNSATLSEMQAALGVDSGWSIDVSNEAVQRISSEKFAARLFADKGFGAVVMQYLEVDSLDGLTQAMWDTYFDPYRSRQRYFHQDFPNAPEQYPADLFDRSAWLEARAEGKVGNPFVVVLDIYKHSGTTYSVSGEGMNCGFDTARSAAVWVPGAYLENQLWRIALAEFKVAIEETAAVHEWQPSEAGRDYGNGIKQDLVKVSEAVFTVVLDGNTMSAHPTFEEAKDAAIKGLGRRYSSVRALEATREQAKAYARHACDVYSEWANGECFSTVVETWKIVQDEDGDTLAKFVTDETSCGYVGRSRADAELASGLDSYFPAQ